MPGKKPTFTVASGAHSPALCSHPLFGDNASYENVRVTYRELIRRDKRTRRGDFDGCGRTEDGVPASYESLSAPLTSADVIRRNQK